MLEEDGAISDLRAINVEEDKLEEVMTDGLSECGIYQCMTSEVGGAGLGGGPLLRRSANEVSMNFCRLLGYPIYKPPLSFLCFLTASWHDTQVDFEGKDGALNHSANMAEAMDEISIDETGLNGSECTIDGGGGESEKVRFLELHSNLCVDIVPSLCGV